MVELPDSVKVQAKKAAEPVGYAHLSAREKAIVASINKDAHGKDKEFIPHDHKTKPLIDAAIEIARDPDYRRAENEYKKELQKDVNNDGPSDTGMADVVDRVLKKYKIPKHDRLIVERALNGTQDIENEQPKQAVKPVKKSFVFHS